MYKSRQFLIELFVVTNEMKGYFIGITTYYTILSARVDVVQLYSFLIIASETNLPMISINLTITVHNSIIVLSLFYIRYIYNSYRP